MWVTTLTYISNVVCYLTIWYVTVGMCLQNQCGLYVVPKVKSSLNTTSQFKQKQEALIQLLDTKRTLVQVVHDNTRNIDMTKEELLERYGKKYGKLLVITTGGIHGYYMMGIVKYITERINLDDYIFSGSSAGAWCCLLLCLKNPSKVIMALPRILCDFQKITDSPLHTLLHTMKESIMSVTTTEDYQLDRLFIGVLRYEKYQLTTTIYSNFISLEDALDCCISSSHIPFLTGDFSHIYQGTRVFDGGFTKYPFVNIYPPSIVINPHIWRPRDWDLISNAMSVSTRNINISEMFWEGYRDTLIHGSVLYDMMD